MTAEAVVVPRSSSMRTNFRVSPLGHTGRGSYARGCVGCIIGNPSKSPESLSRASVPENQHLQGLCNYQKAAANNRAAGARRRSGGSKPLGSTSKNTLFCRQKAKGKERPATSPVILNAIGTPTQLRTGFKLPARALVGFRVGGRSIPDGPLRKAGTIPTDPR